MTSSRHFAKWFIPLLLVITFVVALVAVSATLTTAKAEETTKTIRIGHITDTHIYPESSCNMYSPAFQSTLKTTTKLLVESEETVKTTLNKIYEMDTPPQYMVVTGDLTSDGEVRGHKRLAEIFSEFTAKMRSKPGYENFQILVTPGNHDNYNNSANSYMPSEEELLACGSAAERIALIDSYKNGKTVPSATYEDFFEIYGAFGYDEVKMANSKVSVEYFFDSDQWYDNDGITKKTPPQSVIDAYEASEHDLSIYAPYSRHGALSYIARFDDVTMVVFDGNGHEYIGEEANPAANTQGWEETTGGYIHERQLVWAINSVKQDVADGKLVIAVGHENFLPHFAYEDQVLSLFTYDNWVDAVTALASAGIHYGFSGHMHASDVATHLTQNGDVFYDFETGAPVSFGSPYRYVDFTTTKKGDVFTQDMYSTVVTVNVPINYNAFEITDDGDVIIEDGKIKKTSYVTKIDGETVGLADYLRTSVENMLANIVGGIVNEGLYDRIAGIGAGGSMGDLMNALGSQLGNLDLHKPTFGADGTITVSEEPVEGYDVIDFATDFVDYAFNLDLTFGRGTKPYTAADAVYEIYGGHLSGANPLTPSENVAALISVCDDGTFVEFLIDALTTLLYPQLETILNTPIKFSAKQPAGVDYVIDISAELKGNSTISMVLNLFDFSDVECIYDLLDKVEDILNNPQIDVIALVKSFLSESVDESLINKVLEYVNLYFEEYTSLTEMVQAELVDKYVTDAFNRNLGNYAGNLIESLAVDPSPNGSVWNDNAGYNVSNTENFHVVYSKDVFGGHSASGTITADGYVYDKKENCATVQNGRLPSMVNFTFGENVLTDRNFAWYTAIAKDPFNPDAVPESYIKYWKKGDKNNATAVQATSNNTAFNIPNIDLGITFFNLTKSERRYNKHVVSITDLESGVYEYVLGSDTYGWSQVYTFEIAGDGEEFTFSAIADIQGSVEDNYIQSMENFNAVSKYGFGDFILSAGDNVDNGKNIFHWEWLLNHQTAVWGNNLLLSAAGNHEDDGMINKIFANPTGATITETGYYYSIDYKGVHFVVLDTNDLASENTLSDAQTLWLEEDLENSTANQKINWTIVLLHKGPYTAGSHAFDADVEGLREQLTPIFAENGVDVVLQGHDHTYSVSEYIGADGKPVEVERDLRKAAINPQGVLYINMGTMGDKFYNYLYSGAVSIEKKEKVAKELTKYLTEDGYLELTETPVFLKLDVTANELKINTYAIIGDKTVAVDNIIISDHRELPTTILVAIVVPCVVVVAGAAVLTTVLVIKKKKKVTSNASEEKKDEVE